MLGMIAAIRAPITATATVHTARVGVWTRRLRASASASRGEPVAGPARSGSRPEPRSRRRRSRTATSTRRAATSTSRSSSHPRGLDHARSCVDQPRGESQLSQEAEVVSPTARSRKRTAIVAAATAPEVRALAESWAETAPMPVATSPSPSHEAPNHSEPATGSPPAMSATAASTDTHDRADDPDQDGAEQRGGLVDRQAPEQLGAPGLLLDAGVAAYQGDREGHQEHRVGDRHLGHRQLAEAVRVEDRPVERDQRGAAVDGPGGRDLVGGGRVERAGGGSRRVAHHDEDGGPRQDQDPAPPQGEAREADDAGHRTASSPGRR